MVSKAAELANRKLSLIPRGIVLRKVKRLEFAGLPIIAVDWSKVVHFTNNGKYVAEAPDLMTLLDWIEGPSLIVLEAPYEAYAIEKRLAFIERCAAEGHVLRVVATRATEQFRRNHKIFWPLDDTTGKCMCAVFGVKVAQANRGLCEDGTHVMKTDPVDCSVIWRMAAGEPIQKGHGPVHLGEVITDVDPEYLDKFTAITTELIHARRTSGYTPYTDEMYEILGAPRDLDDDLLRTVLCDTGGRKYNKICATILLCAKASSSRSEYERLMGLYQRAYPSLMRSNVMYHAFGRVNGKNWEKFRSGTKRMEARDFRRTLRKAYHMIKQGSSVPA